MNQVTLTFNGHTWTVLLYSWGVVQSERTTGSHGNPRFKRLNLTLQYTNDDNLRNALFNWAQSHKKKHKTELKFHEGGQVVRTITFDKAECVDFLEEGEFLLDGTGAGIHQIVEIIVPNIQP